MQNARQQRYQERLATNLNSLLADIELWEKNLPAASPIKHHVKQFLIFCEQAYAKCLAAYQKGLRKSAQSTSDKLTFESLIIGILTSQWMILREVASQRLAGPYREGLVALDEEVSRLYRRLHRAMALIGGGKLSASVPLIYLGRVTDLRLLGEAPAVIGIPFGALYGAPEGPAQDSGVPTPEDQDYVAVGQNHVQISCSASAIAHELGHIACHRFPDLLSQLGEQVHNGMRGDAPASKEKVLYEIIAPWLEEIVADVFGTALGGLRFAQNAIEITLVPDAPFSTGGGEHPAPLVRPYIHLRTLELLAVEGPDSIKVLRDLLDELVGNFLANRFEATTRVAVVSLKEVRDALSRVVELIFVAPLGAQGPSMKEVLLACADSAEPANPPQGDPLQYWGDIGDKVPLLESPELEFANPMDQSLRCRLCRTLGLKCNSCRS